VRLGGVLVGLLFIATSGGDEEQMVVSVEIISMFEIRSQEQNGSSMLS
jgi:hypothetical protein